MSKKTYTVEAVIINRRDYGEADRIVTLFTAQTGKLVVLAKGVRNLTSHRLSSLEIGTLVRAMVISGKTMDVLSQTIILDSFQNLKTNLASITRLYQLFEVIDSLTPENQEQFEVYQILIRTLSQLNQASGSKKTQLLAAFQQITQELGFATDQSVTEITLKARIEAIADKKLHARDFLLPPPTKRV